MSDHLKGSVSFADELICILNVCFARVDFWLSTGEFQTSNVTSCLLGTHILPVSQKLVNFDDNFLST